MELDLGQALELFVLHLRASGRSEHTVCQYRRHVLLLAAWLAAEGRSSRIKEVKTEDLAAFLASPNARLRPDGAEKKASSMNALRSSIRTLFGFLQRTGHATTLAIEMIRRARCSPARPRALTAEQEARVLEVLRSRTGDQALRDRALYTLMLKTGLRLGSALAVDVGDLDPEAGELEVRRGKGGTEQVVFVPQGVLSLLERCRAGNTAGPLFRTASGARLGARHARRLFRGVLEAAQIGGRRGTHVLRHTFAMRMYQCTGDVLLVKEALGHRSIASTLAYARVDLEVLRVAVLRSDPTGPGQQQRHAYALR